MVNTTAVTSKHAVRQVVPSVVVVFLSVAPCEETNGCYLRVERACSCFLGDASMCYRTRWREASREPRQYLTWVLLAEVSPWEAEVAHSMQKQATTKARTATKQSWTWHWSYTL